MRTGVAKFMKMSATAETLSTQCDFCTRNNLPRSEEKLTEALNAHKAAAAQGREVVSRVAYPTTRTKIAALVSFHMEVVERLEKAIAKKAA